MAFQAVRIAALAILFVAPLAHGQTYRCSSNGTTYLSDRPCGAGKTQINAYGPGRSTAPQYSTRLPSAPRAEEHVKYLSSGCASISEAIRTGPARGVPNDVIRSLHEEYNQKCSFDDQDARSQANKEKSELHRQKVDQRQGVAAEQQQTKIQQEQCAGMRDVVALKRKREAELNSKEVEALRQLEAAYNQRCLSR